MTIDTDPNLNLREGIPWKQVIERRQLDDTQWFVPETLTEDTLEQADLYFRKMKDSGRTPDQVKVAEITNGNPVCLEVITLANGIRYARIVNTTTGEYQYKCKALWGIYSSSLMGEEEKITNTPLLILPDHINGTDLGKGWVLTNISTLPPSKQEQVPRCQSAVEKVLRHGENTHRFRYEIDPERERFHGEYTYSTPDRSISVTIYYREAGDMTDPGHRDLVFELYADGKNSAGGVFFSWDAAGELARIQTSRTMKEFRFPEDEESLQTRTWSGEELTTETINEVFTEFGLDFKPVGRLNAGRTLADLIRNMDSDSPNSPEMVLVFNS